MAVDLMHFPKMDDQKAIQEAASQGLQSMEHLIRVLSTNPPEQHNNNCAEITDFTVSKFKTVISLLNRTGHARFRRGPVQKQQSQIAITETPQPSRPTAKLPVVMAPSSVTLDFTRPTFFGSSSKSSEMDFAKENFSVSLNSSYMSSAITGDGSVSKGSSIFLTNSSGKPPLAVHPNKRKCHEHDLSKNLSGKISGHKGCHCTTSNKKKRIIRVPAISSKTADIPADEYSWRKYGQKPIKGSPYPRGYYRCSTVKDCPARKHVERAFDDPSMLIVTYGRDHDHKQSAM